MLHKVRTFESFDRYCVVLRDLMVFWADNSRTIAERASGPPHIDKLVWLWYHHYPPQEISPLTVVCLVFPYNLYT